MYFSRAVTRALRRVPCAAREARRSMVTEADVTGARRYCESQLKTGDYEAYLTRQFLPPSARDAYDAFRALNLELARLPETVSNPTIGRMRIQYWKDFVNQTFAGNPPREPISILLYKTISSLASQGHSTSSLKFWLHRLITTRESRMENQPFTSLSALEDYAENTYATLMYLTLASIPVRSVDMDHLASHIGKACGIVAILRGIPVLAAPSQPIQGPAGTQVASTRSPALLLPLDVMAEAGVREEDVFRNGPNAEGLQDAVFQVATRANDHLITAREMLQKLKRGETADHAYEHEGETGHDHPSEEAGAQVFSSVLLEAIPAREYLGRLEAANFDPYRVKSSWNLPWRLWRASRKAKI
ncbi:hypothetical protein OQA88_5252 [Cercophora sp. LCS_1]